MPSKVIRSTLDSSRSIQSLALKLLRSRKQTGLDISKSLAEAHKPFQSQLVDKFDFYSYAKSYWLQHILYFSKQKPLIYDLIHRLLKGKAMNTTVSSENGLQLLWWAVENGHEAVVKLLLATGKVDVNSKDDHGWTPLRRAAGNGHEAVVKLLLATGKVDVDSKDDLGQTPLRNAAENGHEAVVKLLLEKGANSSVH
ncbi:ankyrin [Zopfia rhizophila CBS 207.26]|uniref:Ankyrin n=1 Tax=Zopfia rhizophila CBS 207.26 TaxID=1314779 RepID=A0A6A6E4H8_9PEZI|nr:ankyrin [Zopfia rhizophila CBS 207.26]